MRERERDRVLCEISINQDCKWGGFCVLKIYMELIQKIDPCLI